MAHQHATDHVHHHAGTHDGPDEATLVRLLDLEAQALHPYWTEVLSWLRREADGAGRRRILDLGAGTGTGTVALAQRFAGAEVIALDASAAMLERVRDKALDLGLAGRIRPLQADLDVGWPVREPVDLTWASMSLHHLRDPDRVLGQVFATTRPGGLLAVAELGEPLRFLPDDLGPGLGTPGLEARCLAALAAEQAHALPELGSHWAPRLEAAGFTLLAERAFAIELDPPHDRAAVEYARAWLERMRDGLGDRIADDDAQALAAVLRELESARYPSGPDFLRIRGHRTVTLARRP
jgi:SAM-dependent methyltransferase